MAKKTEVFDYRAKTRELDEVVAALQDADITVDEATKLHAKGVALIAELETYLKQAEIEIKKHVAK